MTENTFRKIALAMQGSIESAHMGHPDFRANGKIFATLHGDKKFGMVKLTPEQQQDFIGEHPEMFVPESGAWGRSGCTHVILNKAAEDVVGEAMTLAWQNTKNKAKKRNLKT